MLISTSWTTSTSQACTSSGASLTAVGPPNGAGFVLVSAETQSIRWRDDGGAPTTTVGMLLAKGHAHGWAAVARMALVLAIMLAPQPGVGVFVAIFSVGHIGTAVPVMLTWLVIDRLWPPGRTTVADLRRRWYVPVLVALLLGWALMADPLVLVIAVLPLLVVCLVRLLSSAVGGARWSDAVRAPFIDSLEVLRGNDSQPSPRP